MALERGKKVTELKQVRVYLPDELWRAVDYEANSRVMSISAVIRAAIADYMAERKALQAVKAKVLEGQMNLAFPER